MDPISPSTTQTPTEQPKRGYKKYVLIATASLVFLLLILGIVFFLISQPKPEPTPTTSSPIKVEPISYNLPAAKFESYTSPNAIPTPPIPLYEYSLKSSFTEDETKNIAQKFFLSTHTSEEDVMVFSDIENPTNRGMLTFNRTTGMFSYAGYSNAIKFAGDIKTASKNFLASLGLDDEAIECNITYQIDIFENATYVECHRSWEKLGLSILSVPGLYNLSESTRISDLKLGYVTPEALDDPSIVNVTTGQNGKIRPNDFNTATFLIDESGTVISVDSSLRFITGKSEVSPLNYENALLAFSENKNVDSFILPAGSGNVDLKDVFPDGVAASRQALVDDFEIAYIEELNTIGMSSYTPVYLLRGTAQLLNGYTVKYVQTTSAVDTEKLSQIQDATSSIQSIQEKKPLKIGTFNPTTPTINPTTKISPTSATVITPTTEPDNNFDCRAGGSPGGSQGFTISLPNGGTLTLGTAGPGAKHTLWVQSSSGPDTRINQLRDQFAKVVENEYIAMYNRPEFYENFRRVSEYGGLAGFYTNNPNMGQIGDGNGDYAPPKKFYDSQSPRLKAFFASFEKRTMAIDGGANDPGPTQNLPFTFLSLTMIGLGEDGNKGGVYRCYLSGGSPSIFMYSNGGKYSVSLPPQTTYADPSYTNSWLVTANPSGQTKTNGITRNFLYYEFDKTKTNLIHGKYGYIVSRNSLHELSEKIATELGLTANETNQLKNEFNHAISDAPSSTQHFKITLIDEEELNSKLPLTIIPSITTTRYHFLVSKSENDQNIEPPLLSPIVRTPELLVELGASYLK